MAIGMFLEKLWGNPVATYEEFENKLMINSPTRITAEVRLGPREHYTRFRTEGGHTNFMHDVVYSPSFGPKHAVWYGERYAKERLDVFRDAYRRLMELKVQSEMCLPKGTKVEVAVMLPYLFSMAAVDEKNMRDFLDRGLNLRTA